MQDTDIAKLEDFLTHGVPALLHVGTIIVIYNSVLLWRFLVAVLFHRATLVSFTAVSMIAVTWFYLPEEYGRSWFRSAVVSVVIFLGRRILLVARLVRDSFRSLVISLGRVEDAWIEKHKLPYDQYEYGSIWKREIRLLKLMRRKPLAELSCQLVRVDLDAAPTFEAISYTWGTSKPSIDLSVYCCRLGVTPEVYKMLRYRRSFLGEKLLWIDAVCINQQNNDEKSHRVGIMNDIFSRASRVVAWLGSPDEVPNASLAGSMASQLIFLKHGPHYASEDFVRRFVLREDPAWSALCELFSHRWFNRVWVIQEIAAAKILHVMYGGVCINWTGLAAASDVLLDSTIIGCSAASGAQPTVSGLQERMTLLVNARLMILQRQAGRSLSLARAFTTFWKFQSTNPSNKVYELLGITTKPKLVPNYNKPFQEVYHEATCEIFAEERPFLVLPIAGTGFPRFKGLPKEQVPPSWVPDLRASKRRNSTVGDIDYLLPQPGCETRAVTTDGWRTIELEGEIVDMLEKIGNMYEPPPDSDSSLDLTQGNLAMLRGAGKWYMEAKAIATEGSKNPSIRLSTGDFESLDEAFWRTIICNHDREQSPAPNELAQCCIDWEWVMGLVNLPDFDFAKFGTNEALPRVLSSNRLLTLMGASMFSRFSVTAKGLLAIVPPLSKKGDLICIMRGTRTPFLLRAKKDSKMPPSQHYEQVGSCYVHHLIESESQSAKMTKLTLQ